VKTLLKRIGLAVGLLGIGLPLFLSYQINPPSMSLMLSAMIVLAFGIWVMRHSPCEKLHRAFFDLCVCLTGYLLIVYLLHMAIFTGVESMEWALRITRVGLILTPAAFLHFALILVQWQSKTAKSIDALALLAAMPFLVLNTNGMFITAYRKLEFTYVPGGDVLKYQIFAGYILLVIIVAFVIVLVRSLQPSQKPHRRLYIFFLTGCALTFGQAMFGFTPVFLNDYFPRILGIGWTFFPLLMGFAILRYGMFNIKVIIRRTLPYALGSACIGLLYALFITLIDKGLQGFIPDSHFMQYTVLFLLTGLCFQPIMEGLQQILDKALFRTEARMERFLIDSGKGFAKCDTPEALFSLTIHGIVSRLPLENAVLIAGTDKPSFAFSHPDGRNIQILKTISLDQFSYDDSLPKPLVDHSEHEPVLKKAFEKHEVDDESVFLTFQGQRIHGILILGEKKSHIDYTEKEKAVLHALARQMATALARIEAAMLAHTTQEFTDFLLQSMDTAVAHISHSGKIIRVNNAFRKSFGTAATLSALGNEFISLYTDTSPQIHELTYRERTYVADMQQMQPETGSDEFLLLLTDITELNQLREREQRNATLTEIGTAVSAINHEIQNILSPIRYFMDKAVRGTPADTDTNAALTAVRQRFQAMESLTQELREYYKASELHLMQIPVETLVTSALDDLIIIRNGDWTPPVLGNLHGTIHADPQRIKRVLVNLLKNAWEAMEENRVKSWEVFCRTAADKSLEIMIRDSGKGIQESLQSRIFEPFFTQKHEKGTGLGLAICRRIIEAHGGSISLKSQEGVGTEVILTFPAHAVISSNHAEQSE